MTVSVLSRPRRLPWELAGAMVAAVMVAGAVIGITNNARSAPTRPSSVEREALLAYERAISAPARDGGFVIEHGVKVGLGQVAANEGDIVAMQAFSWVERLKDVRAQFAAAGEGLDDETLVKAAAAFDAALELYVQTAETTGAAAMTKGEPRARLLDRAAATGRSGDGRYDEAMALLQQARRELGLPPTDGLPRPEMER